MDKIDYQERYDALVKTIVMAGDLLLCNLFFHLACYYGTVIGQSSVIQSHLLVSSIYFACNIKNGIILQRTKLNCCVRERGNTTFRKCLSYARNT